MYILENRQRLNFGDLSAFEFLGAATIPGGSGTKYPPSAQEVMSLNPVVWADILVQLQYKWYITSSI